MYWSKPKKVNRHSESYSIRALHKGCSLTVYYNDHSDIFYFACVDAAGNGYNSMRHRLGYVSLQDAQEAAVRWVEERVKDGK